jgi:hypothetical protein
MIVEKIIVAVQPLTFVLSPWPKGEAKPAAAIARVMEQFQRVANKTSNIEHRTSNASPLSIDWMLDVGCSMLDVLQVVRPRSALRSIEP